MSNNPTKEYSNGELTVVWKPELCIHSKVCVKSLPEVYNPKEKPWIKPTNASTEQLKNQISNCPSGALSYVMKNEANQESSAVNTKVEVIENGPLMVFGSHKLTLKDGKEEVKTKPTAFCRCGQSKNKPFCDGTHGKIDFKD